MKGYLPDDYDVVTLSDHRITDRLKSDVVPITLKKDGSFSSRGTSTLSPAELSMLRNYTNQTIERAATKITQGSLQINPSHHGDRKACDFCSYRGAVSYTHLDVYKRQIQVKEKELSWFDKIFNWFTGTVNY